MAEMLFKKINDNCELGCYSERGLMAYFMFVQLPTQLPEFLKSLRFVEGVPNPFANQSESISKSIIFSELDLGKRHGFGCPDGAIYLELPWPVMIFVEVKINKSYANSNLFVRHEGRNDGYNSTLKGQLELKWRLTELNRSRTTEKISINVELRETDDMFRQYKEDDWFYRRRANNGNLTDRRHLRIDNGVRTFLDLLRDCGDQVYFLAVTKEDADQDGSNTPFTSDSGGMPRTLGTSWNVVKAKFCWLPIGWIKKEPTGV